MPEDQIRRGGGRGAVGAMEVVPMLFRTRSVGLALASVLWLSAGAPTSAQEASPGPSPAASGPEVASPTAGSPEPSIPALDVQAVAVEVFTQAAASPDTLVAAVRSAEIERSGLAEADPMAAQTLTALQSEAAAAFAQFLADAPPLSRSLGTVASPGVSPDPGTSPGASASPSAEVRTFSMLAARGAVRRGEERHDDQGGGYLSSIGEVLGFAGQQVAQFRPSKGGEGSRSEPYQSGDGRFRVDMVADRDTLTLIVEHTDRYTVPGATADAAPFRVTDTGGTTLQVDTCPDEDGTIVVTANASGTYEVAGEGLSYHASLDTNDRATATVNDRAEIAGRRHALTVRGTAVGDRPGFVGGEGSVDSQLDASLTWSGATGDGGMQPNVTLTTAEGVDTRDLRSAFAGGAFTAALVDAAIDAASRVWRDKRCLELVVEPAGRTVEPGSQTQIKVKLEHKAFDEEVQRDVTATLSGTKTVEPSDSPVRAPGEFTYTATDAQEGEGTITFRSVSNRGIAERTETYRVALRLLLDVDGTVIYRFPGGSARGALKGRGLVVNLIASDDPAATPVVTVTGDLQVRVRATSPGCAGSGTKRYEVDGGPDTSAHLVGPVGERMLAILLKPAQPSAELNIRVRCDGGGVTMKLPIGILFPHFREGGELTIPLTGGQVTRSGTVSGVRSRFTYTLRRERALP